MNRFCIVILVSMMVHTNSMVDEYMSCDRLFGGSGEGSKARSARHLLEAIPCDMKKQSFCAGKGAAYPEAAIWRFKEENRALMRRLYGEMDSPTLYREMRSTADKSSNNFQSSKNGGRKTKKETKSKQSRSSPILLPHIARSPDGATPLFSALDYNIRIGSGLATVQGAKDNTLNSRLATRLGGGRLKIKKKLIKKRKNPKIDDIPNNSSVVSETPNHHVVFNTKPKTDTPEANESPADPKLQKGEDEETTETQDDSISTTTVSISTTATISTVSVKSTTSESPTIQPTTLAQTTTDGESTETTNMIYPTTTMESETMFTTDTVPDFTTLDASTTNQDSSTTIETTDDETTQQNIDEIEEMNEGEEELDINGICEILQKMLEKAGITKSCDEILKTMVNSDSLKSFQTEEMPKPEPLVEESNEDEVEYVDDSIYSGSSTSACPVRREVVSPYWANNTRQQTLALLNIYPFEQYVHMEMCKYEHHEMLCRPGCKCEQQYRMHRLLAFDPSNECRGIFSDWFELPSFCVCKCYETATDNFIPRPRKPRIDENQMTMIDDLDKVKPTGGKERSEQQNSIENTSDGRSFQNIPAILPYEAKQALLKEIRHRDNRNLLKPLKEISLEVAESKTNKKLEKDSSKEDGSEKAEKGEEKKYNYSEETKANIVNLDSINTNSKKSSHDQDEKHNKGNFLYNIRYGNLPVMEFKLPDGTSGSVDKVPRR